MQQRNSFIVSVSVLLFAIFVLVALQFLPSTGLPPAPPTRAPTVTSTLTPTPTLILTPTLTQTNTPTPQTIHPPTVLHDLPVPILDTPTPTFVAAIIHLQSVTPTIPPLPHSGASHDELWRILHRGGK